MNYYDKVYLASYIASCVLFVSIFACLGEGRLALMVAIIVSPFILGLYYIIRQIIINL